MVHSFTFTLNHITSIDVSGQYLCYRKCLPFRFTHKVLICNEALFMFIMARRQNASIIKTFHNRIYTSFFVCPFKYLTNNRCCFGINDELVTIIWVAMAMDRAVVLGLASSNPSKIIGNVKKQKTKIDFGTKEEFEKVLSLIYKEDYYQHFTFISLVFLFMTGMRIGEVTAIQWSDIDFESGILKIEKNLYYKNLDDYRFVETKTKASERHIVLDSDTLMLLQEWKEVQQAVVETDFVRLLLLLNSRLLRSFLLH